MDEAEKHEWGDRAKRFTQHALFHFSDFDPLIDFRAAATCLEIANGDLDPAEMDNGDIDVPGDEGYACPVMHGRDCGYRPYD